MRRVLYLVAPVVLLLTLVQSTASAAEDTTAPVFGPVALSAQTVDVTSGPATVTFEVDVTDDLSGVRSVGGRSVSPTGATRSLDIGPSLISGQTDGQSTRWRGGVVVPQSAAGVWQVQLTAQDAVGNERPLATLAQFTVTGTGDSSAPTFGDATVAPATVDVTSAPAEVTFEIDVSDDQSGVRDVSGRSISPTGSGQSLVIARISGQQGDRTTRWRGTVVVPRNAATGTWQIELTAFDMVNNYTAPQNRASFAVVGTSDNAAPLFGLMTVTPAQVSVDDAPATITFEVDVTDELSGVRDVAGRWVSPAGPTSTFAVTRIAGEPGGRATRWRGVFNVPQRSAYGTWQIQLTAIDMAQNSAPLDTRGTFTVAPAPPSRPASIAATAGGNQTATTGQAFGNPLVATVATTNGQPAVGAAVTFTVTGGSANFPDGTSTTVTTGPDGRATAPTLTAGTSPGTVTVVATTPGVSGSASFSGTVSEPPGPARANLAATVSAPATASPGTSFPVTFTVRNAGPTPATAVVSGLYVPKGLRITGAPGGTVVGGGRGVSSTLDSLAPGAAVTYRITVVSDASLTGSQTLVGGSVSTKVKDPDYRDNVSQGRTVLRR